MSHSGIRVDKIHLNLRWIWAKSTLCSVKILWWFEDVEKFNGNNEKGKGIDWAFIGSMWIQIYDISSWQVNTEPKRVYSFSYLHCLLLLSLFVYFITDIICKKWNHSENHLLLLECWWWPCWRCWPTPGRGWRGGPGR